MKTFFCSQHTDIQNDEWKNKGCSISALWMALKTLNSDFNLSLDKLLEEAINIKANGDGLWKHDRVAVLAHNHGLAAYAEEFKSIPFGEETKYAKSLVEYGLQKIYNHLKEGGMVIVSVPKDFTETNKPHSILLTGVKEEDRKRFFIYNDSNKRTEEEGKGLEISFENFAKVWRKLAIFLNKI